MQKAADMISLPIEMKDSIADTKFRLVHITAQRVRQLSAGAQPQVATQSIKDTIIALEEAVAGKFKILTGDEAVKAREEFAKREERAREEAKLSAKEEEIRKELSAYLSEVHDEALTDEPQGEELEDEVGDEDAAAEEDAEE